RQGAHPVAARDQAAHDGAAEEAAAAGDESVHRSRPAAQTASFSRKILALWRTSTGNERWNRRLLIPRVCAWAAPSSSNSRVNCSSDSGDDSGSRSTHSTGSVAAPRGTPTRAVRRTEECALNTPSQQIVKSGPFAVSTRCDLRPQNQTRP